MDTAPSDTPSIDRPVIDQPLSDTAPDEAAPGATATSEPPSPAAGNRDLPEIPNLADVAALEAVAVRRDRLPIGALGTLAAAVDRVAGITGSVDGPIAPASPRLVMFAADHAVTALEVSAYPAAETATRASDLAGGTGITAALAKAAGVGVRVVDMGIAGVAGGPVDASRKVASSGSIDREDALDAEQFEAAFAAGRAVADEEIDAGADLLIAAVCGVGVSTPAAALASIVTGMEPIQATTRGSGIDDAAWIRKAAAVRDARYRTHLVGSDARTLLRCAGGADLAALTGLIVQAASRRVPVMVDDVPGSVAAILAGRLCPGAGRAVLVASTQPERTHPRLVEMLGTTALVELGVSSGAATSSLMALPLLRSAAAAVDAAPDEADARTQSAINAWDAGLL